MRVMLGQNGVPVLLVEANIIADVFDFYVINGAWCGTYTNGKITIKDCPGGSFSSLDTYQILTKDQVLLKGNYNAVFSRFSCIDIEEN